MSYMIDDLKLALMGIVSNDTIGLPTTAADTNTVGTVLGIAFAIIGALAVLFIVVGGFRLTWSQGDPQKIAKARMTILYAVIGLVIAILAEVIVGVVLDWL